MNHNELNLICDEIERYAVKTGLNVMHKYPRSKERGFHFEVDETCHWKTLINFVASVKKKEIYLDTSLFNPSLYKDSLDILFTGSKPPAKLDSFLVKHKNELCMVRILWDIGDLKVEKIIKAPWLNEFYSLVKELKEKN